MAMGFGGPGGDPEVQAALEYAQSRRAMTLCLPGSEGSYSFDSPTTDAFLHQELVEILYHTLWESVHVFLEHRPLGNDAGESAFLYPFLGSASQDTEGIVASVARSIQMKVSNDAALRAQTVELQAAEMGATAAAIRERIERGGKLLLFGNGGSATDANDWVLDCIDPPHGMRPIAAISLAAEPANITALANDLGTEAIFLRQLIAHADPYDVAIAISTSGGSSNVIAALEEARKRKLLTVGLLGYDGGEIVRRGLCNHALIVRSDYIPRIQEVQASIYHTLRELLENPNV
jgi:D-sedoheptulose 7-phosphate isomerase